MKQTFRIFTLLAVAVLTAGQVWAEVVSNSRVAFVYAANHGTAFASEADNNRKVTITVTPSDGWRCIEGDVTAVATVANSNVAESRRAEGGQGNVSIDLGEAIDVDFVKTNEFTLTLPADENKNVRVTVKFSARQNFTPMVSITGWTFDGYDATTNAPTVGNSNTSGGDVTYTYSDSENGTYSETVPTNAGTYYVKASIAATADYNAAEATTSFEIDPKPLAVTITGHSNTTAFDGAEHSVSGYEVEIPAQSSYTVSDFTFSGTASATRIYAGTTYMGLTAEQFVNNNTNYVVTFNVTDGYQTITANLTIGSSGWATYYHEDGVTYSVGEGAKVYYVSGIDEGVVNLTEISGIPSGLPVLVKGTVGTETVVELAEAATSITVPADADGQFHGTATALEAIPTDSYVQGQTYVLYKGTFLLADTNGGIGANKCWLTLSGSNARQLNLNVGDATGITPTPNPSRAGGEWYTLDGRKLSGEPTRKGLHIYNGKKVIK